MGLPRTFVGFSSTDIHCYRLMLAWKENEHIDFNFTNCRVPDEYLLHNGSSLLAGREVLLGVLNDLRAEESA